MDRPRRIALATPYPWSVPHPVNDHVAELAAGFVALREQRGAGEVPQVVVIAPSLNPAARRETRRALRSLARGGSPDEVFGDARLRAGATLRRRGGPGGDFPLLAEAVPIGAASVALRSSLRLLVQRGEIDLLHVHDPLESDLTRHLLRHWPGLSVASFHGLPEPRVLKAHMERILDQVDLPVATAGMQADDLAQALGVPAASVVTLPDVTSTGTVPAGKGDGLRRAVVLRGPDDDALAARAMRALLACDPHLQVVLCSRWEPQHRPGVRRADRGRVTTAFAPHREDADDIFATADVAVALDPFAHRRAVAEAAAAGLPVVRLDEQGVGNVDERLAAAGPFPGQHPTGSELAADLLVHVDRLYARRRPTQPPGPPSSERTCTIDLHMHTSHSWDCATDPEALLYVARKVGLTAIAVTDHNEVSGALACAELADEYGIQVIVGEEVKTSQGEVIGLFLRERIEPGLPWHETIRRIREQDGLVYVPHPFDRMHTIPDVQTLRESLDEIDVFETYNARLAFEQYNRDAERFARKYNLIEGAGSDAHVVQGLGTAAVHMPAWDDPEGFLTALRQGEIVKRPRSLLYLQGLKLLDTVTGRTKRPVDEQ